MGETSIDSVLGVAEVGVIVGAYLFGLWTVQTYTYYLKYPKDSRWLKYFVAAIWVLGLALTILACQSLYRQTITMFGKVDTVIHDLPKTLGVQLLVSATLTGCIQIYFAELLRRMTRRLIIPIIVGLCAVLRFAGLLALAVLTFHIKDPIEYRRKYWWLLTTIWSISVFVDILVTAVLCYYLWPQRSVGLHKTQRVVDHILAWTIQSGLVVSLVSILMLIFFVALDNNAWNLVGYLIPKAFANFLLSRLNSRSAQGQSQVADLENRSGITFTRRPISNMVRMPVNVGITIEEDVECDVLSGQDKDRLPMPVPQAL